MRVESGRNTILLVDGNIAAVRSLALDIASRLDSTRMGRDVVTAFGGSIRDALKLVSDTENRNKSLAVLVCDDAVNGDPYGRVVARAVALSDISSAVFTRDPSKTIPSREGYSVLPDNVDRLADWVVEQVIANLK